MDNDNYALIDHENKLIMFWTPRAGCTTAVSLFFKNMNLFDTYIQQDKWIHNSRTYHFYRNYGKIGNKIFDKNYYKLKIVRNPYLRAVSSYTHMCHFNSYMKNPNLDISFREYLNNIINNVDMGESANYHCIKQYSSADKFIDHIIKIENIESELKKIDDKLGTNLLKSYLYINNLESNHIGKKNLKINYFVGDIKSSELQKLGYPLYKYFYDKNILDMVNQIYREDIVNYAYKYNLEN